MLNVKRGVTYTDHCKPGSYTPKCSSIREQTKISSVRPPDMRCRAVWYQSFFFLRNMMPPSRILKKKTGSSSVMMKAAGPSETSLTFTELFDGTPKKTNPLAPEFYLWRRN